MARSSKKRKAVAPKKAAVSLYDVHRKMSEPLRHTLEEDHWEMLWVRYCVDGRRVVQRKFDGPNVLVIDPMDFPETLRVTLETLIDMLDEQSTIARIATSTIEIELAQHQDEGNRGGTEGGFKGGRPSAKPPKVALQSAFNTHLADCGNDREARARTVKQFEASTGAAARTVRGWLKAAEI